MRKRIPAKGHSVYAIWGILGFWLLGAALLPVVQDEAYYFQWARFPDFGYFDHPPLVTLTAFSSLLHPGFAFSGRWLNILLASASLGIARAFFIKVGLQEKSALGVALLLAFTNILGLVFGILTTPDTWLIFAWILALHEGVLALTRNPKRWLTAGAAVGLGLWAKYIMVLIGPVYLWALWAQTKPSRRQGLRSPWPYLGGCVALLIFLPHIYWNSENDWITMRFQMRHGFSLDRPIMAEQTLPSPLPPMKGSEEAKLAAAFAKVRQASEEAELQPGPFDQALKSLNRYVGYYTSQLGIWGAYLFLFIFAAWQHYRNQHHKNQYRDNPPGIRLRPEARPLLWAAASVPLLFFGTISLFSKVEANWSGMYVFAAAALLTPLVLSYTRAIRACAAFNALALGLIILHAQRPFLPLRPHQDRLLIETHGYDSLAKYLTSLDAYVFSDSFQLAALLRFYQPELSVRQWPGITRPSEFLRRRVFSDIDAATLQQQKHFYLVTTDALPPRLPGFYARSLQQLRDCRQDLQKTSDRLQIIRAEDAPENRCSDPVHIWYLATYSPQRQAAQGSD